MHYSATILPLFPQICSVCLLRWGVQPLSNCITNTIMEPGINKERPLGHHEGCFSYLCLREKCCFGGFVCLFFNIMHCKVDITLKLRPILQQQLPGLHQGPAILQILFNSWTIAFKILLDQSLRDWETKKHWLSPIIFSNILLVWDNFVLIYNSLPITFFHCSMRCSNGFKGN